MTTPDITLHFDFTVPKDALDPKDFASLFTNLAGTMADSRDPVQPGDNIYAVKLPGQSWKITLTRHITFVRRQERAEEGEGRGFE